MDLTPDSKCWCGGKAFRDGEGEPRCADSAYHNPFTNGRPEAIRKLYIAGPMTGYPDANYPAFHVARDALLAHGYQVVSPADFGEVGSHYCDLIRGDLIAMLGGQLHHDEDTMKKVYDVLFSAGLSDGKVLDVVNLMQNQGIVFREYQIEACHGIATLEYWWESTGARNEVAVGGILKMPVRSVEEWLARPIEPTQS